MSVVVGQATDGFRNALRSEVQRQLELARASHEANGGIGARARVDALDALERYLGAIHPDDPRLLALEIASTARGNARTSYNPAGRVARLFANAGGSVNGQSHSSDECVNELVACETLDAIDHLSDKRNSLEEARQRAEGERDVLLGVQEHLIAAQRSNEQLSAQRDELENQLRTTRAELDFERAARAPRAKAKPKVAA